MTRQEKDARSVVVREELEALVRYCQRRKRNFPPKMNLACYFKMSSDMVDYHMKHLIKAGRVMRLKPGCFAVPNLPDAKEVR